ncbi:hypothetical protein EXT47_14380 [Pseudoalteromonas sp. CO342X]|uniref:hypothetical protein n=1 Tax=Pseudoalteromonas sp. CO342X TaxID=1777270 RepID=UPI001022EA88|nr:hypothetical protein [Pseudoalteromonas sp. CO342X]RZG14214.1 hypothetical protein EXT47_14380 [Pseudoalteromonas sp. CO342X]
MFKRTLLALAVSGVAVSANAATIYTKASSAVQADVEKAITANAKGVAGEALGADGVFNGAADDNCTALASALGVSLTNDDGAGGKYTVAASGKAGDKAAFTVVSGLDKNEVKMTANGLCTASVKPTLSTSSVKDGLEYSSVKAIEITPVIVAGIGGYKDEDTITVNLSGAKVDLTKTTAPTITVGNDGLSTAPVNFSFDILDITADRVRFTVQTVNAKNDFVKGGAVLQLGGIFLDSKGLSSDTAVSVDSFATNTSGTDFDVASARVITTLVNQYTASVSSLLDAAIDVGKDRQEFATGTSDALVVAMKKNTDNLELTPAEVHYTITGDFSWMLDDDIDTNKDGKLSSAELGKAVKVAGLTDDAAKSYAVNTELTKLTVVSTVTGAVDTSATITFTVPGYDEGKLENLMIPVQDFTVAVDVKDNKAFSTAAVNMPALSATNAGAWTLNGSVVIVPYMPFGPNTQPILRHTNAGTRTGDITVRYMVEDEHNAWQPLAAAGVKDAKPGVRNMLNIVTDALKAEGYDSEKSGFKVALEIVTNVPSRDVHVYGGAKVDVDGQDRIHLGTFKTNN